MKFAVHATHATTTRIAGAILFVVAALAWSDAFCFNDGQADSARLVGLMGKQMTERIEVWSLFLGALVQLDRLWYFDILAIR